MLKFFSVSTEKNYINRHLLLISVLAIIITSLCVAQNKPSGLRIATTQFPSIGSYGSISASRTNGVAPLSVHFSTDFSNDPAQGRGFHTYDYSWDFGDPSSGVWGTNGKSKNKATGGIAAHVFETPGIYLVTLTIRNRTGVVTTKHFHIIVDDPDEYYAGMKTTCVNPAGDTDFSQAPVGSRQISTNDLTTITQYATAGSRILFKRGGEWTTPGLTWPNNAGPVSIGAYGAGTNPDELGIFENNPSITSTGIFLDQTRKQDWRIYDISFPSGASISGTFNFQKNLQLRLKTTNLGWTHWNNDAGLMVIDEMAIVSCDIGPGTGMLVYLGSERLAFLGNRVKDSSDVHVARIWQAYKSVISSNMFSGSSINSNLGRHALKLHGPGSSTFNSGYNEYGTPLPNTGLLENRTDFCIVSDNIFGSSGPWPVMISPQDSFFDSLLSNIIFERNRIIPQFGTQGNKGVTVAVHISASNTTIRNNIIDGTGTADGFTGIKVQLTGREPPPTGIEIFNNTIYYPYGFVSSYLTGIHVEPDAIDTTIKNNLVTFASEHPGNRLINDEGVGTILANNLRNGTVSFIDPSNTSPLLRSFELNGASIDAIDQGANIDSIFEDFSGKKRPKGSSWDIGAFEYN